MMIHINEYSISDDIATIRFDSLAVGKHVDRQTEPKIDRQTDRQISCLVRSSFTAIAYCETKETTLKCSEVGKGLTKNLLWHCIHTFVGTNVQLKQQ